MSPSNTKYQIKISVVRQETLIVEAPSADDAYAKAVRGLQKEAADETASLEHFVVCSVEELF